MNEHNEFRTAANLVFKGNAYSKVDVKIDTGCGHSSFPAMKLGLSAKAAYAMKAHDCADDTVQKSISFGVNDSALSRSEDKKKFRNGMYMDLASITFKHHLDTLTLDGYDIGDCDIRISYDRTGNILIGMDILKKLDIHIGTITSGDTVLLACANNHLTDGFRRELNSLFDVRDIRVI
jgi:hypothetical protein